MARRYSIQDWRRGYGVVDPTNKEVITGMIWQRLSYTSGTTLTLSFFTTIPTVITDGNQESVTLPNGWTHLVQAIRIIICTPTTETATAVPATGATETALEDIQKLTYKGVAEIFVGSKSYGRWPITTLPAGCGPTGGLAAQGTAAATNASQYGFATNGIPDIRAVYSLGIPFVIPPLYNYRVQLTWSAAQTLQAGNTDIIVGLDGETMRPRQ